MYHTTAQQKFNKLASQKNVAVLGIETSCDETAAAVVKNGRQVLSNVIYSQIPIHQKFGGVVPEIASRNHLLKINVVIQEALKAAKLEPEDLDAIAVTHGQGLLGALLVGISSAKALAYSLQIPLIKVNHIQSHIAANYIEFSDLAPPFLALVASGGHTAIIKVISYTDYKVLGGTEDDAIGEAFDKVARLLNLSYPGGPEIDKLAKLGSPNINFYKHNKGINKDLRLSYSGLKSAVVNYLNIAKMKNLEINKADVCASFSRTAVDALVASTIFAAQKEGLNSIATAGGVAANSYLRQKLMTESSSKNITVFIPSQTLCTDNAAMVASRAYFSIREGKDLADLTLNARANLPLNET